jgi:hypothetical protein
VIRLTGSVIDRRQDIFTLQEVVIREDLLNGRGRPEQLQNLGDANSVTANTRTTTAPSLFP